MIVIPSKKFAFLEKPKCASTTLRDVLVTHLRKKGLEIHGGAKNLLKTKFKYNTPQYRHCNLQTCVDYVESNLGGLDGWKFFSFIRNPFDLAISSYNYDKRQDRGNTNFVYTTFDEMLDTNHYQYFTPNRYFECDKDVDLTLFPMENFKEAMDELNKQFDLEIQYTGNKLNVNKRTKTVLDIPKESIDKVKSLHSMEIPYYEDSLRID